jgi:hypothetical protein
VRGAQKSLPPGNWHHGHYLTLHGWTLLKLGRYEEAERSLLAAHENLHAALGAQDRRLISPTKGLIELYEIWDKPDQAAQWRARLTDHTTETTAQAISGEGAVTPQGQDVDRPPPPAGDD